jgi:hypothetical protein
MFKNLWVAAVKEAQFMDDQSWKMLLVILETKTVFFSLTVSDEDRLSGK